MIPRLLEDIIFQRIISIHKAVIILGARQVGKTTLLGTLQERLAGIGKSVRYLNCDLEEERRAIDTTSRTLLDRLVEGKDAIFVDEIQRLSNPGLTIKILVDLYPDLIVLVTGSSGFELRNKLSDALTGRYIDFILPPFSLGEVLQAAGVLADPALSRTAADALLPDVLRYGFYPEIYLEGNPNTKQLLLSKLVESYLFNDILSFHRIRHSQAIVDLARALAYQIGNEVSDTELANRLRIDRKTVVQYIELLEQSFVIIRLFPFSRNPRREIGKLSKIYFLDLGIRNALIGDFNDPAIRSDQGALWENFLIVERMKSFLNQGQFIKPRFWRAYSGAEVDYLEETGAGGIEAFELKMGLSKLRRGAHSFMREYEVGVRLVNQENFLDFLRI